eukprot:TRINITY_DN8563_c0_g1_i1.p1 TRINITY_DN8563_c0_g1~~TRINITY_DN8563_c0_g1_i1.p1  ORF type:complete len:513 (-),score=130.88 TRINITY_DN8563_c0_g1_i1:21-1559(-)
MVQGQGGLFLSLAVISALVYVPCWTLYWKLRTLFPIQQRWPEAALLAQFTTAGTVIIFLLEPTSDIMIPDGRFKFPCLLDVLATVVGIGSTCAIFLVRAWKLFFDCKISQDKFAVLSRDTLDEFQMKPSWFLKNKNLGVKSFLTRVGSVLISLHFVIAIILFASSNSPGKMAVATLRSAECDLSLTNTGGPATYFIYLILFIMISVKISKMEDNFFIKVELRYVGIGSLIILIMWFIQQAAIPCGSFYGCETFILWLISLNQFIFSIGYPLYLTVKTRQFREHPIGRWLFLRGMKFPTSASRHDVNSLLTEDKFRTTELMDKNGHSESAISSAGAEDVITIKRMTLEAFMIPNTERRKVFEQFMIGEFAVENVYFMDAVRDFRRLFEDYPDSPGKNPKITTAAIDICSKFVDQKSSFQVNLPDRVASRIVSYISGLDHSRQTITVIPPDFFDEAYNVIRSMVEQDSFRRFKVQYKIARKQSAISEIRTFTSVAVPIPEKEPTSPSSVPTFSH